MAKDSGSAAPRSLRESLERACEGLVYSSEADRPFEFFVIPGSGRTSAPDAREFSRLINTEEPVEIRSLQSFFARHTITTDPHDQEAQRIRPRYEALMKLLGQSLRDVKVYRVGKIEVGCYVAGLDAEGSLAGLRTVAIET